MKPQRLSQLLCLTAALLILFACSGAYNTRAQEVSFGPSIRVDDDTTGMNQLSPSLAADPDGNIYVAWHDVRNVGITGKRDIYFSKSTDDGNTWTANVKVNDDDPPNPDWPSLDVDANGNIYVAWEDDRSGVNIYFAGSTDGGETWTNPNIRVNEDAPGWQFGPDLAADDSDNTYVVWNDRRNDASDIYFAMSTDSGRTWTTPNVRVNNPSSGLQLRASTAVDKNGIIYVVWHDNRTGTRRVYFALSTDGGLTWSANVPVSDTSCLSPGYPSVDVDGSGTIYVTWDDGKRGDLDIYFARSTDGGSTWTDPGTRVNDSAAGDQFMPSLAVDGGGDIHVVWADDREGTWHVYFALSVDGGNTWSDPNVRVNDSLTRLAQYPHLDAGTAGQIYVAFEGMQDSVSYDIYFAEGTVTGVEEEREARGRKQEARLLQNNPNPFAQMTDIRYEIPELRAERREPVPVSLKVYDLAGRLVRTLVDTDQEPGYYTVDWDGENHLGRRATSGVYFYRIEAADFSCTKKLVVLR